MGVGEIGVVPAADVGGAIGIPERAGRAEGALPAAGQALPVETAVNAAAHHFSDRDAFGLGGVAEAPHLLIGQLNPGSDH